ncbi:glycosyltransferase [Flavobacterium sp.]|uniref:glycosyltransferase n=1 Tax=Flavobacterium sp. TaxID=239 RepID=UPI002B4B7B38|nr:glycosyltransferase [Flavobacterium sp.]HLP65533.1 glycosyltransferase [Flavobacterium sp.]
MKKKLLFIIPSLHLGGAEKGLINLLANFDYEKYEVDLLLFTKEGALVKDLNSEVNLLPISANFVTFSKGLVASCVSFFFQLKWKLLWHRLLFVMTNRKHATNKAEQYSWKHLKNFLETPTTVYDVAIGFLEKTSIYCCVDVVKAKKKIGFIRTDYSSLQLDKKFDENYFHQLDYLCANGTLSLEILKREFPQLDSKLKLVENVTFPKRINELAKAEPLFNSDAISIATVGRLELPKGYHLAVEACAILVKKGYDIQWMIVGEGSERANLEQLISQQNLQSNVILVGQKENPYPYISQAHFYVQTSLHEGKSNTINEAKILCKPIVVTNFESVFEQITHLKNGFIVEKNAESIANGIITLIEEVELKNKVVEQLQVEQLVSGKEIEQFYQILEH